MKHFVVLREISNVAIGFHGTLAGSQIISRPPCLGVSDTSHF